jgi:desulfoferrodoxin-like iron-binding protein
MAVRSINDKYRCNICGNEVIVTKVGGGTMVCCGEEMELVSPKEKTRTLIEEGYEIDETKEEKEEGKKSEDEEDEDEGEEEEDFKEDEEEEG